MSLYITMLLSYVLFMIIEAINKKISKSKLWILILILPIIILVGFRNVNIGNDTLNYYNAYKYIFNKGLGYTYQSHMEAGYILLNTVFNFINLDYIYFQIIMTIIIYLSIGAFIYKYSNNKAMSIFIFIALRFMFESMNIFRQYISIAILLYSIRYIESKSLSKFLLSIFLATTFHKSSFLFILMYPLSMIKFNKRRIIIAIIISICITPFLEDILALFSYKKYLGGEYFNLDGNIAVYMNLIINIILFSLVIYGYSKKNNNNINNFTKEDNIFISAAILSLTTSIIGTQSAIMDRISLYFYIFYIASIPNAISYIKNKKLIITIVYAISIFLILYFCIVLKLKPEWNQVIPYSFFNVNVY